jgi:hypothetical protein
MEGPRPPLVNGDMRPLPPKSRPPDVEIHFERPAVTRSKSTTDIRVKGSGASLSRARGSSQRLVALHSESLKAGSFTSPRSP